ncbi:MAG TPA: non-homologous end-joining DNA ligase [Acidimicrobiales bacterium]|nr:non-homologous end-joining DNA ligase [Acidimicrobiales bacterium]
MAPLPMKATTGPLPAGAGWVYEVKWDGMRVITEVTASGVHGWSANGRECTPAFPELDALVDALAPMEATLDGEVVALDDAGRPSFERLQHRMHVTSVADARRRAEEVRVAYVLFDLLRLNGHDLTDRPWRDRRRLLEQLADDLPLGTDVAPTYDDGPALLKVCGERGLEGVVAKRADSRYTPGRRTRSWIKVKVRRHDELVVGGWAPGEGNRAGRLGSLLIGYHPEPGDATLRYAGRVGSGFTSVELDRMARQLAPLGDERCPFVPGPPVAQARGAHWVRPEVVVEVAYSDWTSDGRLRHPVYMGQRPDVDADTVVRP